MHTKENTEGESEGKQLKRALLLPRSVLVCVCVEEEEEEEERDEPGSENFKTSHVNFSLSLMAITPDGAKKLKALLVKLTSKEGAEEEK